MSRSRAGIYQALSAFDIRAPSRKVVFCLWYREFKLLINKNMRGKNRFFLSLIIILFYFIFAFDIARAEESLPSEVDIVPPVISLVGEASLVLNVGDAYVEAGATASDDVDGDLTANILISGTVDTAVAGDYTVSYSVVDLAGNSATPVIRQVVVNAVVPIVSLQETFIIRHDDTILWQGAVSLPSSGTVVINDASGLAHSINSQSVLAVLYSIDQSSDAFAITNLQYYDSFGSFYLKCILPAGGAELCDNWQYAVANSTSMQSIDANILAGEQSVGIFFGSPHRLNFETSHINTNTEFLVKAENYNYINNTWDPLLGVSIGVTVPNPDDMWNPSVISTHPVDASGRAFLLITEPNTYNLGIVEDFYFPTYPVTVSLPATEASSSSGGGSSYTQPVKKSFDLSTALDYLKNVQSEDGSFGGGKLFSDWVAIAYGAANVTGSSRDALLAYLKNNTESSAFLTDKERRVMALLALGENPYDFAGMNYVASIIEEFDGQQFGDSALVNDDIFALMALLGTGYDQNDGIIDQTVLYILAKQEVDGSWNKSVDITAAAIQALKPLSLNSEEISRILDKAEQYMLSKQADDGGFGSVYSTAWASQAMTVMNKNWIKNNNTPLDYLAKQQATDGAAVAQVESLASRIWATSYAIPAVLGKDWYSIFKKVTKPLVIEQPIAVESILENEKIEEKNVLGIKEVALVKEKRPAFVASGKTPNNNLNLDDENNFLLATSTVNIQESSHNDLSKEKLANKNIILFIILGILFGGGILFIFFKKK